MKQKDLKIIHELRNNARLPLTSMSKKTRIPVSTLFDRIQSQKTQFLKRFTSIVNYSKLGYHEHVFALVRAYDKETLQELLAENPNVNSIFKLGNEADFAIDAVFHNEKELESFQNKLPGQIIQLSKIDNDCKNEGFFA